LDQDSVRDVTPQTDRRAPSWGAVAVGLGIVYVVWGSTYLGIRIVVEEADPLTAMGARYVAAAFLLGGVLALRSGVGRLRITRRQLLGAGLLGLMLPLLGNGLVSVSESRGVTSGYVALMIAISPLAIVVFRSVERDRPRLMTLAGVLSGFGGLALLVVLGRGGDTGIPLGPALLALFAGSCWAFGSYVQPRLWLPRDPFVIAVYEMLLGGLLAFAAGLATGEHVDLDHGSRTWLAWSYLVVFGSVVAFSAYVWLVANAPISLVATYAYVNPVVAVVLGALILDEPITSAVLVGGAVIVAAVAIVITAERVRRAPETASD
jgi:drug/metabolite transporter (DMT)-like permease